MPQRKQRKHLFSAKVNKTMIKKAVKLETYGGRMRMPSPLREVPEKVVKIEKKVQSTDWSWLYKDWRVWVLVCLLIAALVLAFLSRSGGSEIVSKNKVIPVDQQQIDVSFSQFAADAISSAFPVLMVLGLLVMITVLVTSMHRLFR